MPLVALPTITAINKTDTGSETIIHDSTVYGGSDPARISQSVHLLAYKVDEKLDETNLQIASYDPLIVEDFTVTNTIDGHQRFVLVIVPRYDVGTAYTFHQAVYNTSGGGLYQSISASPVTGSDLNDTAIWRPVLVDDLYNYIGTSDNAPNVIFGIKETVLTFSAAQCLGDLARKNAKENCCDGCGNEKVKEDFDNLWLLVFVANIASERSQFTDGEIDMRQADNYCDCGCPK